ncbi:alpha/beta hydrolase [Alteromonas sp. AMM-1]|uniref:alpha/beta hydrolase n=1 Tax=Alteromonas sp. AMM-1 TaxID=3394233 RepID=UPI0039A68762
MSVMVCQRVVKAVLNVCGWVGLAVLVGIGWLTGCQSLRSPPFNADSTVLPTDVSPFSAYQSAIKSWLMAHRHPVKFDLHTEAELNTPFECGEGSSKGILLVHGLGDSPYFFTDISKPLCDRGYWVRTLLLPGHGSQPGDMLNATYQLWQHTVDVQVDAFAQNVDTLYLGGFSTGANLVTVTASKRNDVAGLLLFSPAMLPRFFVTRFAPWFTGITPWPNVEPEDNPARYNSIAMQGFAAYQGSVNAVQKVFATHILQLPYFAVLAEGDSVVDVKGVALQLAEHVDHPQNMLVWMGSPQNAPLSAYVQPFPLEQQRILAASHMSMLFSSHNALYGPNGSVRICDNGQPADIEKQCHDALPDALWYGPWGQEGDGRIVTRLTFNPYFDDMMMQLHAFLKHTGQAD